MNAVSGKRDVHCNISHGHLYLFYEKKNKTKKTVYLRKMKSLRLKMFCVRDYCITYYLPILHEKSKLFYIFD